MTQNNKNSFVRSLVQKLARKPNSTLNTVPLVTVSEQAHMVSNLKRSPTVKRKVPVQQKEAYDFHEITRVSEFRNRNWLTANCDSDVFEIASYFHDRNFRDTFFEVFDHVVSLHHKSGNNVDGLQHCLHELDTIRHEIVRCYGKVVFQSGQPRINKDKELKRMGKILTTPVPGKKNKNLIPLIIEKYKQKARTEIINAARAKKFEFQSGGSSSRQNNGFMHSMLTSFLGPSADTVPDMLEGVNSFLDKFREFKPLFIVLAFTLILNEVIRMSTGKALPTSSSVVIHFGVVCLCLLLPTLGEFSVFTDILNKINELSSRVGQHFSFESDVGFIPDLAKWVALILSTIAGFSKEPIYEMCSEKIIKNILVVLDNMKRRSDSLQAAFETVLSLIAYIKDVAVWIACSRDVSLFPSYASSAPDPIKSWIKSYNVFISDRDESSQKKITLSNWLAVNKLIADGDELRAKYKPGIAKVIETKINDLVNTRKVFANSGFFADGMRVEPVFIMLRGEPGQGKSTLTQLLHSKIGLYCLEDKDLKQEFVDNPLKFLYSRVYENEYWEGLQPFHTTIVYDDLGQLRQTSSDKMNEMMEIIRAVNVFNYQPHMAELSLKANTFFRSRLIIASTNCMGDFNMPAINTPDAFYRRIKMDVTVRLKSKFPLMYPDDPTKCYHGTQERIRKVDPDLFAVPGSLTFEDVDLYVMKNGSQVLMGTDEFLNDCIAAINLRAHEYSVRLSACKNAAHEVSMALGTKVDPEDLAACQNKAAAAVFAHDVQMESLDGVESDEQPTSFLEAFQRYVNKKACEIYPYGRRAASFFRVDNLYARCEGEKIDNFLEEAFKTAPGYFKDMNPSLKLFLGLGSGTVVTTGVAAGVFYASFKATKAIGMLILPFLDRFVNPTMQSAQPGSKVGIKSEIFAKIKSHANYQAGSNDVQADAIANSILRKNVYELSIGTLDDLAVKREGTIIFVFDRVAVFNRHFLADIQVLADSKGVDIDEVILTLSRPMNPSVPPIHIPFGAIVANTRFEDHSDLALARFNTQVKMHANILDKFCETTKDITSGVLYTPGPAENGVVRLTMHPVKVVPSVKDFPEMNMSKETVVSYIGATTHAGDCGSMLIASAVGHGSRKILSMHCGTSNTTCGLGVLLTKARIMGLYKQLKDIEGIIEDYKEEEPDLDVDEDEDPTFAFESGWISRKAHRAPLKSRIHPSIYHGLWGPAKLEPTDFKWKAPDGTDLYRKNVSHYSREFLPVPSKVIYWASMSLWDFLQDSSPYKFTPQVFDVETAIKGIDGDKFFSAISRKTSPGYPYHFTTSRGKKDWLGEDESFRGPKYAELMADVHRDLEKLKNHERPFYVFTDNIKDAKLKKEQIIEGKARIFSGCNLSYLIICRMYFGDFTRWIATNNTHNGIAIGLNPYSDGWKLAFKKLTGHGEDRVVAGDYSKFDASEQPAIHAAILDLINAWYNDDNDDIRRILWQDLVNSRHIYGTKIYSWNNGLPSGHALTATVNSLYNHLAFRMSYYLTKPVTVESFNRNVFLLVMGDDNVANVSKEADWFNELTIPHGMSILGLKYTKEDKDSLATSPYRSIWDVEFLKRKWRSESGHIVAPLRLEVVLEELYWVKEGNEKEEHYRDMYDIVCRELSLHGKDVYNRYTQIIRTAMLENGPTIGEPYMSWYHAFEKCRGTDGSL